MIASISQTVDEVSRQMLLHDVENVVVVEDLEAPKPAAPRAPPASSGCSVGQSKKKATKHPPLRLPVILLE